MQTYSIFFVLSTACTLHKINLSKCPFLRYVEITKRGRTSVTFSKIPNSLYLYSVFFQSDFSRHQSAFSLTLRHLIDNSSVTMCKLNNNRKNDIFAIKPMQCRTGELGLELQRLTDEWLTKKTMVKYCRH